MMSTVSGRVVFLRKIARLLGPSPVGGGPFVRNLSRFCQEFPLPLFSAALRGRSKGTISSGSPKHQTSTA